MLMFKGRLLKILNFWLVFVFFAVLAGCATVSTKELKKTPSSQRLSPEKPLNTDLAKNESSSSQKEGSGPSLIEPSDEAKNWDSTTLAHYTTGLLYERQGKIEEAIEQFKQAAEEEPDSFAIHQALGIVYFKSGRLRQAEGEFQTLFKISPDNPVAHRYMALLYYAQGRLKEAEDHFKQVIESYPESPDSYFALAGLYVQEKRYAEAVEILEILLKIDPQNPWVYIEMGRILSLAGKGEEAVNLLRRGEVLFPDEKEISFNLGAVYEAQENWIEAAKIYEKLLTSNPHSISLNFRLANVYTKLKKYDKVVERYQTILDSAPRDVKTLSMTGMLFYQIGKYEEALKIFNNILKIEPNNIPAKLVVANLYEEMKMFPEAAKIYEEVILEKPDDLKTHLNLASLYLQQNEFQKAIDLFKGKEFIDKTAYFIQGVALLKLKRLEEAAEFLRRVITVSPDDYMAHFYLGIVYEQMGDLPLSIYEFKETIKLNPKFAEAYNYLAYMYAERGIHLDEAVELAHYAVSMEPENGAYLDTLAWVHYKKEMYNLALKELKTAVSLLEDPVVFEHLGDVYYKKNQFKEAEEAWKNSLRLDPQNKTVQDKLKKLKK